MLAQCVPTNCVHVSDAHTHTARDRPTSQSLSTPQFADLPISLVNTLLYSTPSGGREVRPPMCVTLCLPERF